MATTAISGNSKITESNPLSRYDFDGGPVSYDEVEKNLFLGNITAATHMETLKNLRISYILTLDSVPLPAHIVQAPFLTTKYVHISDVPKEDLLHHLDDCISFIDHALNEEKPILVHCYFGVSRSAAVIIAYMMKKYAFTYSQAFEKVKEKRRFVGPNTGFIFQLKLYQKMGYKIDSHNPKYKIYRLRLAADKVRKAKILPQNCMDLVKSDPGLTQENPEPIVYRCRKCRRIVASKSNIITHIPRKNRQICATENDNLTNLMGNSFQIESGQEQTNKKIIDQIAEQSRKTLTSGRSSENEDETACKSILFIEPIAWMKDILTQTQGRLNCPKCTQKIGNFSWINGCQCPCDTLISPAFYLIPSKVELSNVVQNVQMTV